MSQAWVISFQRKAKAWEIWKQRNGYIFRNKIPSFQAWKTCFIDTIKWQLLRCKESEHSVVLAWLDSI
ncbi:hypothetical protein PVAP13_2KG565000 [Panicum virgatum]|uniref:Uncharacterized protein n=1 Tax=Panicum virgatum TaxID=38727 RepID=A0A8T0WN96_PANVG|nr:hypothetical protein PVAP13_2KG565000 [Panicum virgatum]